MSISLISSITGHSDGKYAVIPISQESVQDAVGLPSFDNLVLNSMQKNKDLILGDIFQVRDTGIKYVPSPF